MVFFHKIKNYIRFYLRYYFPNKPKKPPIISQDLYQAALSVIDNTGRASATLLQRELSILYSEAAEIINIMEKEGIIGPADGVRPRKVFSK